MHTSPKTQEPVPAVRQGRPLPRALLLTCCLVLVAAGFLVSRPQPLHANSAAQPAAELFPPENSDGGKNPQQAAAAVVNQNAIPSIWPVSGAVTSNFGWRNSPGAGGSENHLGIDIGSEEGAPVAATADGKVVKSGWTDGYGNTVEIDHGNGIITMYGHNAAIAANLGQTVKKGQVIAYVGNTGKSTGPHLHYEIKVNGVAVNPMPYLVQFP